MAKGRVAIDLMGGDLSPQVLLESLEPLDLDLLFIGPPSLAKYTRHRYLSTPTSIEPDESPLHAIRRKPDASLLVGLRAVRDGSAQALISYGNTGALAFGAKMILGMQPGVLRPALCTLLPTKKHPLAVLDLGAIVPCKAAHLVQFASLGAAFQNTRGIAHPRVGLLNIGTEPLKGTSDRRTAYRQLQKPHAAYAFVGNVEARHAFEGNLDVLVTDGFTGNIFLKTAEGVADFLGPQCAAYAESPGAYLLGVQGTVIKCHGYATPEAIARAAMQAI